MSSLIIRLINSLPKKTGAHLGLLSAQVCFSGWHIVGSLAMKEGANPFVFVLYRELLAAVLMYAYVRYSGVSIKIEPEDRLRFLVLGFFSFVNVVGAMLALKYISATRFAIFQPVIPCVATVISIGVRLEKMTLLKAAGILIAVGGAIITELWKSSSSDDDEEDVTLGTIIVVCQVVGMGCLIVFSKPILCKYPPSVVTVTYYSIGAFYTILLTCAWAYSLTPNDMVFDSELMPWLGLAYAATFATFYPYNVFSWAGKQLSPGATTVYCTFQPVGTIVLSFILLGAVVTLSEGLGALMVIAGLVVTLFAQQQERERQLLALGHKGGGSDDGAAGEGGEEEVRGSLEDEEGFYYGSVAAESRAPAAVIDAQSPLLDHIR
jgi:drug/metabolite transporter (DMT)-like permease